MEGACAIGRHGEDGAWVGFVRSGEDYRLAIGLAGEIRTAQADADLLLSLAIAYFEDALEDPPPQIEATHADLSDLVRYVAVTSAPPNSERRRLLDEAVDAIDDGLAVDAVINRLTAAIGRPPNEEQADPVDLLLERVEALRAEP